jgi:hypothetical protein
VDTENHVRLYQIGGFGRRRPSGLSYLRTNGKDETDKPILNLTNGNGHFSIHQFSELPKIVLSSNAAGVIL